MEIVYKGMCYEDFESYRNPNISDGTISWNSIKIDTIKNKNSSS